MRPSITSSPVLLVVALLLPACDSPKQTPPPATASAEADPRAADPVPGPVPVEGEAAANPPVAVPVESPAEPATPAADPPPTPASDARADAAAALAADRPTTDDPAQAQPKERSAPDASTALAPGEGRLVSAFTECRSSETFADGRCYASRKAACDALSCAATCIDLRSMPPQVTCG